MKFHFICHLSEYIFIDVTTKFIPMLNVESQLLSCLSLVRFSLIKHVSDSIYFIFYALSPYMMITARH
jgi:hypothetical protein